MPQIPANQITLEVEQHGERDKSPLILIRGLGTQLIHWPSALLEGFVAAGFFVITFDNRDTGLSTKFDAFGPVQADRVYADIAAGRTPNIPYTLSDMAGDVVGILEALSIARAHVLGISMGGMIAQVLAAEQAGRCLSMTSVMSSSGNPSIPFGSPQVRAKLLETPTDTRRKGIIEHSLDGEKLWASPGFPRSDDDRRAEIAAAYDRCYCPDGVNRQWAAARASGSRVELLKTIATPSLVIHGTADTLLPIEHGEDTARHIPNAAWQSIEGMGHNLDGDIAQLLVEAVTRHARRAEANEPTR